MQRFQHSLRHVPILCLIVWSVAPLVFADQSQVASSFPANWEPAAQRDEIRPSFSFDAKGGPGGTSALVICAGDSVGQQGWFRKSFPLTDGGWYQFHEYPVFQTKLGKIGMMVCYDGFFPEVARELTNRGAEIIAWPVAGCNPLLAQARACENHVYVVSSTYTDSKSNWMISAVFDHAGKPIARAEHWDDVAVAEVDLGERYFWRNNLGDFHAMAQRHRPPVGKTEPAMEQ